MLNIQVLVDDTKCFEEVRKLRWPEGVRCPHCGSEAVIKRGFHTLSGTGSTQPHRQRYVCQGSCCAQFDDLTGAVFEGHHQPLKVWVLCLYFMGLNLSNRQTAKELDLNEDDVQQMTTQLREGVVAKKSRSSYQEL
jgi:transposase-like protein